MPTRYRVPEEGLTFDERQVLAEMARRGLTFETVRKRGRYKDLSKYQRDPVAYASDVLDMRLTAKQEEIAFSVVEKRRTSCQACHGVGKTITAAVLSNWWYDCWDAHIVYITAPSWRQALDLTFKQVRIRRIANGLPGEILQNGLVRDDDEFKATGHYIKAINSESGEGFQGEHTAPILMIFEEAVGVPPYIWAASDGLMTSRENRLLAIGNPTNEATEFGSACSNNAYNTIRINGLEHPNVLAELAGRPMPFPGAVELTFIHEMLIKETEAAQALEGEVFEWWSLAAIEDALNGTPVTDESPRQLYLPNAQFQGRVLGLFPTVADQQVIPKSWLEGCPRRDLAGVAPGSLPAIGVDVANTGTDRTTAAADWDGIALFLKELRHMSVPAVTGAAKDAAHEAARVVLTQQGDPEPDADEDHGLARVAWEVRRFDLARTLPVRVDVTGGLGRGPYDQLIEDGYNAIAVNSAERALMAGRYPNKRSELWFAARERARDKELDLSRLPDDLRRRLVKELSLPRYENDGKGRKVVQDKKAIKKALGYSPDLADGYNLALYDVAGTVASAPPRVVMLPSEATEAGPAEPLGRDLDSTFDAHGRFIPPRRR
jgi:hypothetical protein